MVGDQQLLALLGGAHGEQAPRTTELHILAQPPWLSWASVSASVSSVTAGDTFTVLARTNLITPEYTLMIIDQSTGREQDQSNPIITPAHPARITPGSGQASWTLTAARPGSVIFRVYVSGRVYWQCRPSENCYYSNSASATSVPVTVVSGPTVTNTPTPTLTPTQGTAPAP